MLDVRDLWSLRGHCIRNHSATLMEPNGLRNTLENHYHTKQSASASRNITRKKKPIYVLCTETLMSSLMDRKTADTCSVVKWVQVSAASRKTRNLWRDRPSRLLSGKGEMVWYHGRAEVSMAWVTCICVRYQWCTDVLYIGILERQMLPLSWRLFVGDPWLFKQA